MFYSCSGQERGASRCQHTEYGHRVRTENGVNLALSWPVKEPTPQQPMARSPGATPVPKTYAAVLQGPAPDASLGQAAAVQIIAAQRPFTAPVLASTGDEGIFSLPGSPRAPLCEVHNPRFAARSDFEARKAVAADP